MKWVMALALGTFLASCGADGEPVQPTRNATSTLSDTRQQRSNYTPGVHVSGYANVGVVKGF